MLHDHPRSPPGGLTTNPPKAPWVDRVAELAEFTQTNRHFPRSYVDTETSHCSFLQHQWNRHRAGPGGFRSPGNPIWMSTSTGG